MFMAMFVAARPAPPAPPINQVPHVTPQQPTPIPKAKEPVAQVVAPQESPVTATTEEPKADPAIEQRSHEAERKLKLVKPFIDRGEDRTASKRLKEIIEQYGDTPAAEQAQKMLNKLEPIR